MGNRPRFSFIFGCSVVLAAVAAAAWTAPLVWHQTRAWLVERPHPIPASAAQQQAIMRALLTPDSMSSLWFVSQWPGAPSARSQLLLLNHTVLVCRDDGRHEAPPRCMKMLEGWPGPGAPASMFSRRLRRELVGTNKQPLPLTDPGVDHVRLLASAGQPLKVNDPDWWHGFYLRHPNATGLLRISRATLAANGQTALVLVSNDCDSVLGMRSLIRLTLTDGRWQPEYPAEQLFHRWPGHWPPPSDATPATVHFAAAPLCTFPDAPA